MRQLKNRRAFLRELGLAGLVLGSGAAQQASASRPVRLGFTPFRPDLEPDAWGRAFWLIAQHADLVGIFLENGVPWQQALLSASVADYPAAVRDFLQFQADLIGAWTPAHSRYIALNPLGSDFKQLAAAWTEAPHDPLSYPWNTYDFDHPAVKEAYLNYCRAIVDLFQPEYLNIAIESNILLARNYEHWAAFKELYRYVYARLKAEFPAVQIFSSVMYEHMLGLHTESRLLQQQMSSTYPDVLVAEVRDLLSSSDLLALSTYPYMISGLQLSGDYYEPALRLSRECNVSLAIDQTGYTTQNLYLADTVLPGSDEAQSAFLNFILQTAAANGFHFVLNFVPQDYGTSFGASPVAMAWAYTGLYRQDGVAKPALTVWEQMRSLPFRR